MMNSHYRLSLWRSDKISLFLLMTLLPCLCAMKKPLMPQDIDKSVPVFTDFVYIGDDQVYKVYPLRSDEYYTPILQGCYPDPSITRKGEDYYLVNSSFAFFPGVPIFQSRDLVNWKQIGHVIDQLAGGLNIQSFLRLGAAQILVDKFANILADKQFTQSICIPSIPKALFAKKIRDSLLEQGFQDCLGLG